LNVLVFSLQVYRLNQTRNLSLEHLGNVNWQNVGCLGMIYLICYFSMWKGVKTSGKVKDKNKFYYIYFFPGRLVHGIISLCCINNSDGTWPFSKWFNEGY